MYGPGGEMQGVSIDGVTIRYEDNGSGPTVVFVHGLYVAGSVWSQVVDRLDGLRSIVPTWPLGAHADPAPTADLSARAIAKMIPRFLDALDLQGVTVVANDTGGGLVLASLATGEPGLSRIRGIVLTNCDSYEHFPPKGFDTMIAIVRKSQKAGASILRFFASKPGQKIFLKAVSKNPPRGILAAEIFGSFLNSPATRADALRTSKTIEPSVTLDAVDALRSFEKPVLLIWGDSDRFFPVEHAMRLKADFPEASLELVEGAATYVMLDRPDEVAASIAGFVGSAPLGSA
jgi:pimeloyl-ACP methyl ester carboxylesterase